MLGGQNVYQQNTTIPKLPPNQMPQNQFYGENAMVKNRESQYSTNPWTMYSWSNPSAIESWEGSGIAGQNIQGGGYSSGKTGKAYNADGSINREMTKGNKQAMGGMGQGGMGFGQGGMGFGQIPVGMTEIMKPISQMIQPSEYNEKVGAERPGFVSSLWEDNTLAQAGGQFGWVGGTIGAFADKIKNAFNYGNKLNQYNEAVGTYNIKEGIDKQNQFAGTDYTRTAKYGLEAPAQKTLVNVEPYEIGVIKGEDGKYKKVFETDEETPIHEYGGENKAVQPGTIIFPQPFLKDVKSAVDNEDTEKVEKLADIMLARSKKASQLNLPYSNQSATQLKLNELMQSKYGSKIPKYAMGGVTYSENNPYTPGFEQMYEGFSPVIGFEDPVMAQQGIKQMPLFNQNRFDGYAKGGEHTHEALHNQPMPLNPLQKFANGGIAGDPPPNFAQVKQDNTFFQQPPLPRFFNEEEIMAREKGAMELDSLQKEYAGNPYLWEEVKKLKQQSLNMDADIREADTKLHIAKQRKFGYPFLGGKSYFAYGGIAGPGDPPKKKVKSNLGGIDFPMIDYNQGESTTVVKPIIMPRTDTQPSTLTTDQQRALYNRTKESIGSSAPNVGNIQVPKQVSEGEKLFNQLKSPLTTIGGQLERNPLDYATDVVNPFAYLGLAKDAWDYASQGQFGDATFAATAAMPFFPMFKFGKAKTATKSFDELAEGVRTEIKGLEKSVKPYDEILETTDPKKLDEIAGITKSADDIKRADFEKKIMSSTDPDELQAISNQMKIDELSNKYFQGKGIPQFNPYIRGASMWRKSAGDHLSDINKAIRARGTGKDAYTHMRHTHDYDVWRLRNRTDSELKNLKRSYEDDIFKLHNVPIYQGKPWWQTKKAYSKKPDIIEDRQNILRQMQENPFQFKLEPVTMKDPTTGKIIDLSPKRKEIMSFDYIHPKYTDKEYDKYLHQYFHENPSYRYGGVTKKYQYGGAVGGPGDPPPTDTISPILQQPITVTASRTDPNDVGDLYQPDHPIHPSWNSRANKTKRQAEDLRIYNERKNTPQNIVYVSSKDDPQYKNYIDSMRYHLAGEAKISSVNPNLFITRKEYENRSEKDIEKARQLSAEKDLQNRNLFNIYRDLGFTPEEITMPSRDWNAYSVHHRSSDRPDVVAGVYKQGGAEIYPELFLHTSDQEEPITGYRRPRNKVVVRKEYPPYPGPLDLPAEVLKRRVETKRVFSESTYKDWKQSGLPYEEWLKRKRKN